MTQQTAQQRSGNGPSLISKIAGKYGVDSNKLLDTLKATAFRQKEGVTISNEQMMALLIVADQYNLNPFTKEIYAFPDKNNGIVPVVGVDGWARIVNEHPQFDGLEFIEAEQVRQMDDDSHSCPVWIKCVIYRKDRSHPVSIKEHLEECYKPPITGEKKGGGQYKIKGHWQTHTKRALRHKAFVQTGRIAFAFVGIYDEDEASRIIEGQADAQPAPPQQSKAAAVNNLLEQLPSQKLDFGTPATQERVREPVAQSTGAPAQSAAGFADAIAAVKRGDLDAARDLLPVMSEGEHAQIEVAIKNHEAAKQ